MAANKSRYREALPFAAANASQTAFRGMRPRHIGNATGVLEYTIKEGDRLDLLAQYFYVDSRKWWRILDANPDILFGADLMLDDAVGETILIPRAGEPGASS